MPLSCVCRMCLSSAAEGSPLGCARAALAENGSWPRARATGSHLIGTEITCKHFVPGQRVNVQGITQGKGFQGVMRRWGFHGLGASHGVSVSHRSLGSTGQRENPGKTFKGKKMPGHMGNKRCTVQNLLVGVGCVLDVAVQNRPTEESPVCEGMRSWK